MRRIKIFDTTLRDGEQSPGCSMNLGEKLEMAAQLEELGVDIIEAGFAVSSPEDFESVRQISALLQKTTVASLARATKSDIDVAFDAVKEAKKPRIHVFLASSDIHLQHKLHMTREEMLRQTAEMVRYAKGLVEDIEFSAEDASRTDWNFLVKVYETAIASGANVINVPDTVGYVTPNEMFHLISYLKANVKGIDDAEISVHCHNDLGMAVANSLASVQAGAEQVECTVNGIGERAGNASMEEVVMALRTRQSYYDAAAGVDTTKIYKSCKKLSAITGVPIGPTKPVVGANAFAHEAGIHQHGVLNDRLTYEIMTPESVGISHNTMVLGKHSGRHAFDERLKSLGYTLSAEALAEAFADFKKLADLKKNVTDRDLEALLSGAEKMELEEIYSLESYVVNTSSVNSASAMVKLGVKHPDGKKIVEGTGIGSGPVNAALSAIDTVTGKGYTLENFSIQAVTEGDDALGEVVVRLKNSNGTIVSGRGVNVDIIGASLQAYVNALNRMEARME
ncbi:2-isopropylmalate synthase [Caproiciproducens sp. NJN-50]|nr:2-isopropylmalate synthase [Caproiciproducens sp. NJN-50]